MVLWNSAKYVRLNSSIILVVCVRNLTRIQIHANFLKIQFRQISQDIFSSFYFKFLFFLFCLFIYLFIFCTFQFRFIQYYHFSCSTVSGVLEKFTNVTNTLLLASLYGFQFHQSPYVTIECTVRICNPNSICAKSKVNVYKSTYILRSQIPKM